MTGTFIISSILFLLVTFAWPATTETHWSTEGDAEEEEESKQNVLLGNESFRSTLPPEDSSTTKLNFAEKKVGSGENVLWNRRLNFSEYDELHEESKPDASPENSVDRDSLDNVNYFLQENPVTESSNFLFKGELSSTHPKTFLISNETTSSTVDVLNSEDVSSTTYNCASGDRKCKSSQLVQVEELQSKFNDKIASSSSDSVPSSSVWNIHKSLKSEDLSSEGLDIYSSFFSTPSTPNSLSVAISPSKSTTVETSENVILIDGTEIDKNDSVIQNQPNKSEKLKPVKHHPEELSDVKTLIKITTPVNNPIKESVSSPDVYHTSTPTFVTTLLNISPTKDETLVPSEAPIAEESIVTSKDSQLESKTELFTLPNSVLVNKIPASSVDFSKISRESSSQFPSLPPTVSWYNEKSYILTNDDKHLKWSTENVPVVTPLLSPSFRQSATSTGVGNVQTIQSSFSDSPDASSYLTTSTTVLFTPALEAEFSSHFTVQDSTTLATLQEAFAPPPRITNPSCSSLPVCVEITLLETTWEQFCAQADEFREFISKSVSHYTRPLFPHHIILDAEICTKSSSIKPLQTSPDVTVEFYVTNDAGEYEERLTEICGVILRKWAPTAFRSSVIEVRLYNSEIQSTPLPLLPELNSGFVAAVSISAVAGVALCLLCILLVIMKQKLIQGRNSDTTTPTADAYSLDSLSINASFRRRRTRRSARSYLNHAFNDQEIPSHPLDEKTLTNCLKSRDLLEEEFKKIPMNMPKLDSIPEGAHVKNRYSNILPKPETRVVLTEPSGDPFKCYINANYIKGYEGKSAFYIAGQAPLPEGVEDFWKMIWEQQSRVIIMLTMFEENGVSRCTQYFPQSTLVSQAPFGDFQISLLKKDVYEFYTMSTLRLLDLEKNLFRDIVHLWFTGWPDVGVPKDPSSLITFVQQCRPYVNSNTGPTIVHCSTGTGRTGVFLALDICMREYDESRSIDILQCVSQLRRDRGGAVQNKDQYILIYEAILEYVSRMANQSHCPSICSKNS